MAELKKAIFKVFKKLAFSVYLVLFFVIGFQIGMMYHKDYIETGNTFSQWLDMDKDCEEVYHKVNKDIDFGLMQNEYSCDERIIDYGTLIFYVRIEVILIFLMSFFDYFIDPDNHYFNKIKEMIKSTSSN